MLPPLAVSEIFSPLQMVVVAGVMATTGIGFTVTVPDAEAVHPPVSVTVTVYIVVAVGLTLMLVAVAPVFHKYALPPEAVSVTFCPLHIVAVNGETAALGVIQHDKDAANVVGTSTVQPILFHTPISPSA
jgi:hypothetical protein